MAKENNRFDPGVLENILDSVPQAIFWKDIDSVYQGCNAVFAHACGLDDPSQIVGKTDFNLPMPGTYAEAYRADDRDVIANNRPKRHIEEPMQQADGKCLWVDTTKVPLIDENGKVYGVLGIFKDITERKLAVEALKESETLLRATLEATADGILVVDEKGHCTHTNAQFAIMWRIPEDLIASGDDNKLIQYVLDQLEDPDAFRSKVTALYQTVDKGFDALRFKDGRFFERYSCPLLRDGRIAGRVWSFRDITGRKQAEDLLARNQQDLERIVKERTAELESFCYSVSHDLRAPLRSACGFSQALMEDCDEKLDAQGKDYLRRIQAATRRMDELIDAVLSLSRITRKDMSMQDVDLSPLVRVAMADLRNNEPQRQVEFSCRDTLMARGDVDLLRIAIVNLVGNAWKFTSRTPQAMIEVGQLDPGAEGPSFFVKDNGVGFDMAYSDKLFTPFQRLHTEAEFPGAGIGLATVRRIIIRHGGRIWVQSSPGKGATFHFTLPSAH